MAAKRVIGHSMESLRYAVVIDGFAVPPDDLEALAAGLIDHTLRDLDASGDISEFGNYALHNQACALASLESMSAATGIDRKILPAMAHRFAASLMMLGHIRLKRMEEVAMTSLERSRLVHYVEAVQYDETPLFCKVVGDLRQDAFSKLPLLTGRAPMRRPGAEASGAIVSAAEAGRHNVKASGAPQRIMQTQGEVAMVLRVDEKFITFIAKQVYPLAALESCSAECIQQQQLASSRVGRVARLFKGLIHSGCDHRCFLREHSCIVVNSQDEGRRAISRRFAACPV